MSTFLVTGGAGFIGSHLAEHLLQTGHRVRILDNLSSGARRNVPLGAEFIEGDIRDGAHLGRAMDGTDGCYDLAAVASVVAGNERWSECHQTNITGTIHVFEAARDHGHLPVVYASSAAIYGANEDVPLPESAPARPLTAYGADKYACELHAVPAFEIHGVPTTGMRFFNVYGPRQDPHSPYSGVISIFADRFGRGDGVTIHGDGGQSRDFVYVGDVCRALMAAMATTAGRMRVFNVCTGRETSVVELAETLSSLTGGRSAIQFGPERAGDIRRSLGDNSALVSQLGVTPTVTLRSGLEKTLATLVRAAA